MWFSVKVCSRTTRAWRTDLAFPTVWRITSSTAQLTQKMIRTWSHSCRARRLSHALSASKHITMIKQRLKLQRPNGLVERFCPSEHGGHVRHPWRVPRSNGLVERFCPSEHVGHVRHRWSVPGSNGLVEGFSVAEHVAHVWLWFRTTTWLGLSRPQHKHLHETSMVPMAWRRNHEGHI